jgi:hypothetical protein
VVAVVEFGSIGYMVPRAGRVIGEEMEEEVGRRWERKWGVRSC